MRINPISAASCNLQTKKINFGMIDNERTEKLTWNTMMKEVEWMDKEDKEIFGYKETVEEYKKQMEYFKASRLFTLKSKKNNSNEDVLFVTMNQEEVDKHEHKDLLDEMIQGYKDFYDPANKLGAHYEAQEAGLPGEEKGFLRILFDYDCIQDFYNDMQNNEQGIIPSPPPEPSAPLTTSSEPVDLLADDAAYQAYKLYGV